MTDRSIALVTGGSRGIGRAISLELAKEGRFVVINYRTNEQAAQETLQLVKNNGSDGMLLPLDVTDQPSCHTKLTNLIKEIGPIRDLVNNAGVTKDSLFAMMSPDAWSQVIDTSLNGFYNVTKPILKSMMKKRSGSIVVISSVSGMFANRGQVNYSAAKAGLIGATRSLAAEVGRLGVRVNAVAPGLIETDMTADLPREAIKQLIPMNRMGHPDEVARVVRFLCSDDASYITGQVIGVNGGML